jgi:hypothetical protein
MKTSGIILVVLALTVAVVPQFTDCLSQGKTISLPNGATIPMKCHWTAQAELALAVPLAAAGVMMALNRHRGTLRALSGLGAVLGLFVILVPTSLIGVCGSNTMLCNMVMRPWLIFAGVLAIAVSAITLVAVRQGGPVPATVEAEAGPRL